MEKQNKSNFRGEKKNNQLVLAEDPFYKIVKDLGAEEVAQLVKSTCFTNTRA